MEEKTDLTGKDILGLKERRFYFIICSFQSHVKHLVRPKHMLPPPFHLVHFMNYLYSHSHQSACLLSLVVNFCMHIMSFLFHSPAYNNILSDLCNLRATILLCHESEIPAQDLLQFHSISTSSREREEDRERCVVQYL